MTSIRYLVLLEAVGKQQFIFETNMLRHNLGASQLVFDSTAGPVEHWLDQAAGSSAGGIGLRERIAAGPPMRGLEDDPDFEVIMAPSGKALLITRTREVAEQMVFEATASALVKSPGLRVVGVIEPFDWLQPNAMNDASSVLHRSIDSVAAETAFARHLRLPIVDDCAVSGLPAQRTASQPGGSRGRRALSSSSIAKEAAREIGRKRLEQIDDRLANSAEVFDGPEMSWIAVIHADGNGLGRVFMNFGAALRDAGVEDAHTSRTWVEQIRAVSNAVEDITLSAFREALSEIPPVGRDGQSVDNTDSVREVLPLVPIVLGGDDLTAVCFGGSAWAFTRAYLESFNRIAADPNRTESEALRKLLPDTPLTASAGIAFVKHHFPFSDAYRLAEQLTSSAKGLKPKSAVDFHVLYDSNIESLATVRRDLVGDGQLRMYGGPYELGSPDLELLNKLQAAIEGVDTSSTATGHRQIARSQLAKLRDERFRSRNAADQRSKTLFGFATVLPKDPDGVGSSQRPERSLEIDAMAIVDVSDPPIDARIGSEVAK